MSPALKPNDYVLASSLPFFISKPKINDIIICVDPRNGKVLVKRIIKIDKNGFFVAGDNSLYSTDSREFGYLTKSELLGKVIYILK